jgi:hypothetical protein
MTNPNMAEALKNAAPQQDWEAQAKFWQLKYFEYMNHTNQIIQALSQPMIQGAMVEQLNGLRKAMQDSATAKAATPPPSRETP